MSIKINSPIKYFGGKSYLAKQICALFPPPEQYHNFIELFSGGASVLFAHEPVNCAEYLNDLNGEIENFWRVLREPDLFAGFVRIVQATPFSEATFRLAQDRVLPYGCNPITRAVRFFVLNRLSRSGGFQTFATLTRNRTRRGIAEQASAWLGAVEGLPDVHARLAGVVLLKRPALAVIDVLDADKGESLFYADPPYWGAQRAGAGEYENTPGGSGCEMLLEDHIALLDKLAKIRGKFLLSGYHSDLYDDYAREYGWNCTEFSAPLASAGGDTKRIATECVWRNYGVNNGMPCKDG
jgi:DNA adenine methylase